MNTTNRLLFLVVLAGSCTLCACDRDMPVAGNTAETSVRVAKPHALTLDQSKLPPVMHFSVGDLDTTRDACNDFFAYVNGKWLAAHPIPADRSRWGPTEVLAERSLAIQHQLATQVAADGTVRSVAKIVGDFWATGMDEAKIEAQGITPLNERLAAIDALSDPASIAAWVRRSTLRGESILFNFMPLPDFKNSGMNIAYAMQGGLGLPDKGYYFDANKQAKLDAYRTHIAKVLELSGVEAATAANQAEAVIVFETRLAKVSLSNEDIQRDRSLYYHPVSPTDADMITPNFPWTVFLQSQGLPTTQMFSLMNPGYHAQVSRMMADEPIDTWKAYLRFHIVDEVSPYLSKPFAQEHYAFHGKAMDGQKQQEARWKRVLGTIDHQVGEAMGQLYVKVAFPPESKVRMQKLVANLGIALKARIQNVAWMGDATRKKALEKWATFDPRVGYPDTWRDWSGLKTSRDSYLGNVLAARAFNYRWALSKIGKPVDKSEWRMNPQRVNAYYWPFTNQITFPAAILHPPFFDPDADLAMNYGAIGAVIGHEMTHGYDDQGSRFGQTGNFENWWTEADHKAFTARAEKLIEQFDGYEVLPGLHVNGRLTLGENIADLGGLVTAYDAMKRATQGVPDPMIDGLSRDQRFFLGFGITWRTRQTPNLTRKYLALDPHAPDRFRAVGAPANVPAFAKAFDCKPGDAMARSGKDRVVIW